MNSLELQLKQLLKLMADTKIDYAVLGGIAVSIYGEPRMTYDIDVNIALGISKIDDFLKKAKKYGFTPIVSKGFIKSTGVIPMRFSKKAQTGKVDFIIAQNDLEYLSIKRARIKKINTFRVKIVSPEDLIIHKITSNRPRDLEDVSGILDRQKRKLDYRYINLWLKKVSEANRKPELLHLFKNLLTQ